MSSTSSRPVWEYASRKHEQATAIHLMTHHAKQKPSFSFRMTGAFCIFTDGTDDIQVFTSRKNNSHEMQECRRLSHYPYKVSGLSRPATPRHEGDERSTEDDDFLAAVPPSRCRDGLPGHRPDYKEMFPAGREPYSQRSGILFPSLGNPVPGAWESDSQPAVHFRIRAACTDRSGFVLGTVQIYPDSTKTSFYIKNRCALPDCSRLSLIGKQT